MKWRRRFYGLGLLIAEMESSTGGCLPSIWKSGFLEYLPDQPEAAGRELWTFEDAGVASGESVGDGTEA